MGRTGGEGGASNVADGHVMKRPIRSARFVGRLRLPTTSESCLMRCEIAALQDIVEARNAGKVPDTYLGAPGFDRLAAAYVWLLAYHEKHRDLVAVVLSGKEVH